MHLVTLKDRIPTESFRDPERHTIHYSARYAKFGRFEEFIKHGIYYLNDFNGEITRCEFNEKVFPDNGKCIRKVGRRF